MENQVRIHVDGKPHESPTPTPGADLYELAGVHEGRALYKEVTGNEEDKLVLIQAPHVHLRRGGAVVGIEDRDRRPRRHRLVHPRCRG